MKKYVSALCFLVGGAVLGIIYSNLKDIEPLLRGEMLSMMLPVLIINIVILGMGVYSLLKS